MAALKSTVQKDGCSLPLKVSDERDETLAKGLKHEQNCGRLGLRQPVRNQQEGLKCSRKAELCSLLLATFYYIY